MGEVVEVGLKDREMSDYQVTNYGICGECKWHKCYQVGFITSDWFCENPDSDNCTLATEYTDTCECFEQRGVE